MSYITNINNQLNVEVKANKYASPAAAAVVFSSQDNKERFIQPIVESDSRQEQKPNQHTDEQLHKAMESLKVDYGVKVELAPDDNGKIFVRIMSSDGERVLRQMPPDALIKIAANIKDNRGLLADWLV